MAGCSGCNSSSLFYRWWTVVPSVRIDMPCRFAIHGGNMGVSEAQCSTPGWTIPWCISCYHHRRVSHLSPGKNRLTIYFEDNLVGGLEHQSYFPINIGNVIIPIDFHICSEGWPNHQPAIFGHPASMHSQAKCGPTSVMRQLQWRYRPRPSRMLGCWWCNWCCLWQLKTLSLHLTHTAHTAHTHTQYSNTPHTHLYLDLPLA